MQPSVDNLALGDFGMVMVADADGRALDAQLVIIGDCETYSLERLAQCADTIADRRVDASRSAGLSHTVAFQQWQTDAVEEVRDGHVQRGAATHRVFALSAEDVHDLLVYELVVDGMLNPQRNRNATTLLGTGPCTCDIGGTSENPPFCAFAGFLRGGVVDLLEDSRYSKDEGRFERMEISEHRLEIAGQTERHIPGETHILHVSREDVG